MARFGHILTLVFAAALILGVPARAAAQGFDDEREGVAEIDILHQVVEIEPFAGTDGLSGVQTMTFEVVAGATT